MLIHDSTELGCINCKQSFIIYEYQGMLGAWYCNHYCEGDDDKQTPQTSDLL